MIDNLFYLKKIILEVNENIKLKPLTENDITEDYINWMNDLDITRYTEQRFQTHTFESVSNFLKHMSSSKSNLFFGIFFDKKHIGSIKIGSINFFHNTADISYLIGSKNSWGKGIATLSIKIMLSIGFKNLKLKKITAGVYKKNIPSIRVLEKNGFTCEGNLKQQFLCGQERVDGLIYAKFLSENKIKR